MRNQCWNHDVNRVLADTFEHLAGGPWRTLQRTPGRGIALDPAFDPAINVVEKHGVRAGPTAPYPTQQGGDEKQEEAQPGDRKEHHPQVLRHERKAKQVEHPVFHIEKHRRVAVDRNPRQQHVDCDEQHAD